MTSEEWYMAARIESRRILENQPSLGFVPNRGQRKVFEVFQKPNGTELGIPYITVFGAGNGVGKTCDLAIMAEGCAFGERELNETLRDNYLWKRMARIRLEQNRPLRGRIICHADSMKENGPVLTEIRKWFPKGRYKMGKGGKTYYSEIKCYGASGEPSKDRTPICTIDVKTHDQDKGAHAGSNLDFVLCDEPMPENLYAETVGRTRGGGFIVFFLTPLEMSGWMMKQIIEDVDGVHKVLVNASIWDNCRDIPGTNGHLRRSDIENMIREWSRLNPMEVEARINGTFTHLSGAIYRAWRDDVHVIRQFKVPEDWPCYQIVDPHDARPPAVTWIAQGPTCCYVVAEYPQVDYTQMGPSSHTISHHVAECRRIEESLGLRVQWRYGDPNKLEYPYPNSGMTVRQEYAKAGLRLMPSDDNLQVGHEKVSELLYFNHEKPVDVWNAPRLQVFEQCENVITALKNYALKKNASPSGSLSSRLDQKYKDFADLIRYFAVKMKPFAPVDTSGSYIQRLNAGRQAR